MMRVWEGPRQQTQVPHEYWGIVWIERRGIPRPATGEAFRLAIVTAVFGAPPPLQDIDTISVAGF